MYEFNSSSSAKTTSTKEAQHCSQFLDFMRNERSATKTDDLCRNQSLAMSGNRSSSSLIKDKLQKIKEERREEESKLITEKRKMTREISQNSVLVSQFRASPTASTSKERTDQNRWETISFEENRQTRPHETQGPVPRPRTPLPVSDHLERDAIVDVMSQYGIHQEYICLLKGKVETLNGLLAEKTKECEEAKKRFQKLEVLARQLHSSWQEEQLRTRRLEEELILKSQEKNRPDESSENLKAIEKKYHELKMIIERSGITKKGLEKLDVYESGLKDSFELFSEIFEAVVLIRNSKSSALEIIQQKIMSFFHQQSSLIKKFGFQEKLVSTLRANQSKNSTADKQKKLSYSKNERQMNTSVEYSKENIPPNSSTKGQRIVFIDEDSLIDDN